MLRGYYCCYVFFIRFYFINEESEGFEYMSDVFRFLGGGGVVGWMLEVAFFIVLICFLGKTGFKRI